MTRIISDFEASVITANVYSIYTEDNITAPYYTLTKHADGTTEMTLHSPPAPDLCLWQETKSR